jgi:hypothetical protein
LEGELWHYVMRYWRHKRKFRNADFIIIAAKGGDTTTLSGHRPLSNLRTLRPGGQVNLKNLLPLNPLNPGRKAALSVTNGECCDTIYKTMIYFPRRIWHL